MQLLERITHHAIIYKHAIGLCVYETQSVDCSELITLINVVYIGKYFHNMSIETLYNLEPVEA